MTLKLIEKGNYCTLPFEGFTITGIDFRGFLGLELAPEGSNLPQFVIDINLDFELTRFNQKERLSPNDKEAIKKVVDLIGLKIKKSDCSKSGDLFLILEDDTEITVPDAEYESWHINIIQQERIKNSWLIDGVGQTTRVEW